MPKGKRQRHNQNDSITPKRLLSMTHDDDVHDSITRRTSLSITSTLSIGSDSEMGPHKLGAEGAPEPDWGRGGLDT